MSHKCQKSDRIRDAVLASLQGPQFSLEEFCHIGRPHRVAALAIGTLKPSTTDILTEQELHRFAAFGADRGRGILWHDAHADKGESIELTVTGNCRGWGGD